MKEKDRVTQFIFGAFRMIPLGARRKISCGFFRLLYQFSLKHRIITIQNLLRAYPEKRLSEIISIAKGAYRHLGIVAVEAFEILSISRDNAHEWLEVEGLEHFYRARKKKKGILFFTGHFGNWEIMAAYFGLVVHPIYIVYRTLDSPLLDRLVTRIRKHTGNSLIPKGGAARRIIRLLRQNQLVGVLIDQNVSWREGLFVDFFGRPASTTTGFASLALQTEAPVVPGFIYRKEDGTYSFTIQEEVELIRTGDYERDLFENTQRYTKILEDAVREHPEQWFWLHQRWKTKRCQVIDTGAQS